MDLRSSSVTNLVVRLFERLITGRNNQVTDSLKKKYNGAEIFCISNRLYSEHRHDSREFAEAYISLSGVRKLRRYCQKLPAEAQFRTTAGFLEHQTPAFLGSLNQWALAGSDDVTAERVTTLRQILLEGEEVFHQV